MVVKYEYAELVDFIKKNKPADISPKAKNIIATLLKKVLRPGYARAPKFARGKKYGRSYPRERSAEPSYAPKPKIAKEDAKELEDDLRKLFNKLTGSKYESLMPKLIDHIAKMRHSSGFTPDSVLRVLFTVIENTPFYSRMYGKCYATLAKENEFLKEEVSNRRVKLVESLKNIESANPNTDYDKFCEVNKDNNRRQAMAKFLTALAEEQMEDASSALDLLNVILDEFDRTIEIDDKKDVADALSNLVGSVVIDNAFARTLLADSDVKTRIVALSKKKASSAVSLTHKSVFKFMDIRDFLNTSD